MPEHDTAVGAAVAGELRLLDPQVRRSPELVGALLHPACHEYGVSGRHWDRATIIDALTTTADQGPAPAVTSPMAGVRLAPDVVHLTYDTETEGRHAHRSSVWRRSQAESGGRWLLYFHQGTPYEA